MEDQTIKFIGKFKYLIPKKVPYLLVGSQTFLLTWDFINCGDIDDNTIVSCMKVNDRIEYDTEPKWVMAYRLYRRFCFSLNYATMEIGLAKLVNPF
jgi:hypothetical protein